MFFQPNSIQETKKDALDKASFLFVVKKSWLVCAFYQEITSNGLGDFKKPNVFFYSVLDPY